MYVPASVFVLASQIVLHEEEEIKLFTEILGLSIHSPITKALNRIGAPNNGKDTLKNGLMFCSG